MATRDSEFAFLFQVSLLQHITLNNFPFLNGDGLTKLFSSVITKSRDHLPPSFGWKSLLFHSLSIKSRLKIVDYIK